MSKLDVEKIRRDFPLLQNRVNDKVIAYLDSAATSQKPTRVIESLNRFYAQENSNVHRGAYQLSQRATDRYEQARTQTAHFIGATDPSEIIFTRGTTESINLLAHGLEKFVTKSDEIWVTRLEHHSNFVPWQTLALRTGAKFRIVETLEDGKLDLEFIKKNLSTRTKIFAFSWVSNVLGTVNPVKEIAELAKEYGTYVVLDGAQGVPNRPTDITQLGPIDFLAFSSHKMCGPTGVGVLWGRKKILEEFDPYQTGGSMILKVGDQETSWAPLPNRFEAGTPNIGGVIGFSAALDYLTELGMDAIHDYELELTHYALERLSALPSAKIYGPVDEERGPAISFEWEGIHSHDLATYLDECGIAVRAGHHCAQPLMAKLGVAATTRASFYFYNTREEIDLLVEKLAEADQYFKSGSKGGL